MTILHRLAGRLADWLNAWSTPQTAPAHSVPTQNQAAASAPEATAPPASSQEGSAPDAAPADEGRTTAEKITTLVSVLLIASLAGAILYEGYATGASEPAILEVTVLTDEIEQRAGRFYVPVEIRNDGDETVEEVTVSIEVRDGETVVDEGETTIATLGESETLTAVLVLADDPAALTIDAGVVTFQIAED